ncbi:MAG: hypothetical protein ACKOPH_07110, partial [Methylocystis sp.]
PQIPNPVERLSKISAWLDEAGILKTKTKAILQISAKRSFLQHETERNIILSASFGIAERDLHMHAGRMNGLY